MERLLIKLNNKQAIVISKSVFVDLLEISHIKEYKDYIKAIDQNEITFINLKKLATKAGVPYPLFFAPKHIVDKQIENKDKNLYEKIPSKEEIRLSSRGRIEVKDIELIAKDLGRKQEFLKNRVLLKADPNKFIGSVGDKIKKNIPVEEIATEIREYLGIDLIYLRSIPKDKVLNYITTCSEKKGILISFSSYNYMPQNINPELELSGICIKDKKFPYIFINTRDGDEKPKIIESAGRQIFTLLSMLAFIGMGKFLLSSKSGRSKNDPIKLAYAIAGEIIIPQSDLNTFKITTLDELKERAHFFKITPSMLLYKLEGQRKIGAVLANSFRQQLQQDLRKAEPKQKRAPHPTTGYGKYNGLRFSKEIINAYRTGLISQVEVKNILFRQGKMDGKIFNDYNQKYN
ncbi:MAG: hypothetical protein Q8935_00155 [Bacillota bacterium]|nr:hypothetical protein [Bacillota bacterium]